MIPINCPDSEYTFYPLGKGPIQADVGGVEGLLGETSNNSVLAPTVSPIFEFTLVMCKSSGDNSSTNVPSLFLIDAITSPFFTNPKLAACSKVPFTPTHSDAIWLDAIFITGCASI